ncbi:MAG TPA: methyltransferase domain-containing protein [Alphaproteobacteria bacterium]|nr:methyltransferase domain-containing protein [Alphaproteobacteria bacterium]
MTATPDLTHVLAFYDRHPISAGQILAKVAAERGSLEGLTPADFYPHDQDHYGGLAANDVLHARAHVNEGSRVLDLCAGLAWPARYCAAERGAQVTALELNPGRAAGAARLNALTGMAGRVRVVRGDAQALPLTDASFEAVLGQEAFLHISDKPALFAEAFRVLAPGGRIAFTDWIAKPGLSDADRAALRDGIAAIGIETTESYRALVGSAGFTEIEAEDLSAEWEPILRQRLAMYERLREEARDPGGKDPHAGYVAVYRHFVDLVSGGALGGGRFSASR